MDSIVIVCLVCLGGCIALAFLTLGLAGLVLKLYTEYLKDQKQDRRQAKQPGIPLEGQKLIARLDGTPGLRDPDAPCDRILPRMVFDVDGKIMSALDDGLPADLEERMRARHRDWNDQAERAEAEEGG